MKPSTMRAIDRHVGRPLCALLTAVRRVRGWLGAEPRTGALPGKILFIKMAEQGATVLAYRALCRAVELVGRQNVYVWVFADNRAILDLLDIIPSENVFAVRSDNAAVFMADSLRTLVRIRGAGIDATVDLELLARLPAILAYLTGARRRVGLHRFTAEGPYRGDLLTHRVQYNPHLHTAIAYCVLVEALRHPADEIPLVKAVVPAVDGAPPLFEPRAEERERLRATLERMAEAKVGAPIVLLNPNAGDLLPLRRWPKERFVELGQEVLRRYPSATVVITGGPAEAAAAADLARALASPRVISVAGHTTLRELLVLYTIADVLVTNDSGPGHFASMTDIDSIVLFGPETPALYAPLGRNTHVVWAGLACSPCVNAFNQRHSPCTNNVCMQAISTGQILAQLEELLAQRPQRIRV